MMEQQQGRAPGIVRGEIRGWEDCQERWEESWCLAQMSFWVGWQLVQKVGAMPFLVVGVGGVGRQNLFCGEGQFYSAQAL